MSAVGSGATDASRAYARLAHRSAQSRIGEKIRNDLQCDGASFVDSIKEDLRKSLCTQDILDLTGDIDESKMQILIMLVSAILKIPPQLESISATLAAMFCKSMLREVCP
jgi:hypothetical protein